MREILFKAKRKVDGKWIEGYLFRSWERACILWGMINNAPDMVEVEPATICQYTEKNDISGKRIYEHDIVGFMDTYSTESGLAEYDCEGEVVWDEVELCFYVKNRLSAESWEVLDECTVIRNFYDTVIGMATGGLGKKTQEWQLRGHKANLGSQD